MDCCETTSIKLQTPVGILQISGCDSGLHFVRNISRNQQSPITEPDLNVKCQTIEEEEEEDSATNFVNKPIRVISQCVDWFCNYFSLMDCDNHQRSTKENNNPILNGQHPTICPNLKLSEFAMKVYLNVASDVRFGSRISYSGLAELIGHPKAARTVGTALKNNPFGIVIPCHRVIQKSGNTGFYNGGADIKQWLLQYEKTALKRI